MADTLQSVHQALRILTLLRTRDELGVSEIAAQLGIGKSSTYRLLATLKEDRYVDQTPSRNYRLGPAMSGSPDSASIAHCVEVAAGHLESLRDATGETVHVSVLNGGYTEFVAVCESEKLLRVSSKIGLAVPAYCAAAGKVLLATLTDAELAASVSDPRIGHAHRSRRHQLCRTDVGLEGCQGRWLRAKCRRIRRRPVCARRADTSPVGATYRHADRDGSGGTYCAGNGLSFVGHGTRNARQPTEVRPRH